MASMRITVVGGINMDIGGCPERTLIPRDSNPGQVSLRPGGVGRNIAQDLCLLGAQVRLLSAVGEDEFGAALLESCRAQGMDVDMTLIRPRERSSTYLYITDEAGDMQLAIADMSIMDRLTPEYLSRWLSRINDSDAVVLDANLSTAALNYLAENVTAPLYADPVSAAKAVRLKAVLGRLSALKPNRLEAEALTGEREPENAVRTLLAAGVKRVFLSLGADGMLAAQGDTLLRLSAEKAQAVNTTGAGDAATAALVWAKICGFDLEKSARAAQLAGAITTECREASSLRLSALPDILNAI